jgi:hypothetical protein
MGRWPETKARFREAEDIHAKGQPETPLLYSIRGFRYCDLLLTEAERAAWKVIGSGGPRDRQEFAMLIERRYRPSPSARRRRSRLLRTTTSPSSTSPSNRFTLGRAALYAAILEDSSFDPCYSPLQHAVDGLRRAGQQQYIPLGLLTRAWLRFLEGRRTGPESARRDLDEAWEIAERGPMKLFLADIHLHRARLFFREAQYPWDSPAADLAAARELIEKCGYGRRKEELEDAERAIGGGGT